MRRRCGWSAAITLIALVQFGCDGPRTLVVTPNLLHREDPARYFAPGSASPEMQVVYATDRAVSDRSGTPSYGYGRSKRLVFGTATVELTPHPAVSELLVDSVSPERKHQYTLRPGACQEIGAFDPFAGLERGDVPGLEPNSAGGLDEGEARGRLHAMLRERLKDSPQKDVFVFVHGFNTSFADAVYRAGETWHFLGRVGVPVAYTWPAGHGGPLGYLYDRESGEFTVFHLKQFLCAAASCPEVERVHLIAHSRGTDVAITALRELHIALEAAGKDTRTALKLENLVLAAPDLDEDVFAQRFVAERLLDAAGRTTIYTSEYDRAIELADVAFASKRRLGRLGPRDFSPQIRQVLAKLPQLQFIECKVTHFSTSHDYAFAHPAALSDLILVLRDRRPPGAEHGRPLRQPVEGVWELTNDYLLQNDRGVVQASGKR